MHLHGICEVSVIVICCYSRRMLETVRATLPSELPDNKPNGPRNNAHQSGELLTVLPVVLCTGISPVSSMFEQLFSEVRRFQCSKSKQNYDLDLLNYVLLYVIISQGRDGCGSHRRGEGTCRTDRGAAKGSSSRGQDQYLRGGWPDGGARS